MSLPLQEAAGAGRGQLEKRIDRILVGCAALLCAIVVPLLVIGRGAAAILVPIIGGIVVGWTVREHRLRALLAWRHDALGIALIAMLVAWLATVPGSIKFGFSLAIWFQAAGLMLLASTLPRLLVDDAATFRLVLRTFVVASLLGCALAAVSIFVWPPTLSYVRPVDTPTPYYAALRLKAYAAVMPCLAPVVLWAGRRLGLAWLVCAVVAVILGGAIVYGTGNRAALGGYAGVVGVLVIVTVLRVLSRRARVAALVAIGVVVAALAALVVTRLPAMPYDGTQPPQLPVWLVDAHRQVIWGFVLDRALERPLLGWGVSTANFLPGANDPIPVLGQTFVPLHPHNWVLQLFSDTGAIGLATAFIALGLLALRLGRRAFDGDAASLAGLALMGAFFVSTLANFSIWQSWWQSVFVILLALALAGSRLPAVSAPRR